MKKNLIAYLSTLFIIAALTVSFLKYSFDKNQIILDTVMSSITNNHYSPKALDDNFSNKFFDLYIKMLDRSKIYLMQADVENLSRYKNKVDDQLKNETFELFDLSYEIISRRISEKENWYKEILSQKLNYKSNEEYQTDGDKVAFAKNEAELKNRWKQYLQYLTLARLNESLDAQDKIKGKKDTIAPILPFDTLEAQARTKVMKSMSDYFKRIKKINSKKDRYAQYVNMVATMFDPHTEFFPPREKKRFDQTLSGQLEGIGARLQQKDEFIKITELVVGGPAYKEGQLKAGDLILKVGQASAEPVDIVGMDIDDAIDLIKGKKGTEVRLTVKKTDGSIRQINLIRDIILLDETFAHSAIIQNQNSKTGYIKLPSFYSDFTRNNAHHCTDDMRKEIQKLKALNVEGIIIDLRDNGGGSLSEVVDLSGLFIKYGPIVQVRNRESKIEEQMDRDPSQLYDGPLVILINRNSASASEIMAAALQDYKRAVIIGTQSFGKGTVQNFIELDRFLLPQFDSIKPLGSLKITISKFYRINGGTTQLRGVTPDITLPDAWFYIESGEKELDNPMPWDEIQKASYSSLNTIQYDKIKKSSQERVGISAEFKLLEEEAKLIKSRKDDTQYSLDLQKYLTESKKFKDENKKFESLKNDLKNFKPTLLPEDLKLLAADTNKLNREKKWADGLKKDVYLQEACFVISDLKK